MEEVMKEQTNSNKKITWAIIIGIIIVAAVLIIVLKPFQKTEEFSPSYVYFSNSASIYKGEVGNDGLVLNDGGYVSIDLTKGQYGLYYKINECPNASANFKYSYPDATGKEVFYDPFKEKVITNAQGVLQKVAMTEDEKVQAVLKEKLYVLSTENTSPVHSSALVIDSVLNFEADGMAKFLYNAKCDGSYITLTLYKMD
jgi:hypothetical protein